MQRVYQAAGGAPGGMGGMPGGMNMGDMPGAGADATPDAGDVNDLD